VTTRWSVLEEHKVNIVIVPGTEDDVAETVSFDMPISRFTIAQVDC
jgi:hypothetical protein